jgi:hypothetical protein
MSDGAPPRISAPSTSAHQRAKHLRVGGIFGIGRRDVARRDLAPILLRLGRLGGPRIGRFPLAKRRAERADAGPRVGNQRQRVVLGRIEDLDVETDEAAVGIFEQGP